MPIGPRLTVYFALEQGIFGINVPVHKIVHDDAYVLVNIPESPRVAFMALELPPIDGEAEASDLAVPSLDQEKLREELENVKGKLDAAKVHSHLGAVPIFPAAACRYAHMQFYCLSTKLAVDDSSK